MASKNELKDTTGLIADLNILKEEVKILGNIFENHPDRFRKHSPSSRKIGEVVKDIVWNNQAYIQVRKYLTMVGGMVREGGFSNKEDLLKAKNQTYQAYQDQFGKYNFANENSI